MNLRRLARSATKWTAAIVAIATAVALGVVVLTHGGGRRIGAGVVAIGTKVPQGLHASVVDGAALPFNTDAVKPISKLYRLDPSGPLPSTTTIRLPLISTVVADSGDLIIGVRAPSPEGPWAPLQAEVSTDGRFATFQTDHLSLFGIVRVIVRGVRGVLQFLKTAFDGFSGGLTAKAENPQCAGESAARRDQYTVISESKDTILWCFGLEEGRRVLRVVNNRRYPLIVEHPGLTVIDDGPSFQFRLAQLARAISGRSTVLFPNEQALFGVNLPNTGGTARLHTELNGAARSLYALEIGLRTAAMLLTYFGAGSGVPVNGALKGQLPWLDKLDETLRHADCFANITDVSFNVGKLIATCLSPARLLELFGRSAIFLAPIMAFGPVINFFKSEFNALLDQFNSRDQYNLSIGRANVAELCPSGRSKCFGIRQADVDGDGRPDTVSLVFDPKYEDCRAYGARVMFASGDSAQGDFCFPGPEEGRANPLTERVSFLGFTDLNRDGKQEIFAKLFVNHQWYIGVLGDREKGNQNVLEQPQFDGLAVGFPLSLTRPFFSDFFSHADYEAGGFHCGKSSDGQARLIVWSVRVSNQDKQYDFTSVTYQLDEADIFAQVPSAFRKKTLPLHDPNTPRRLVAQKSAITCPGLDPLPAAASK